MNGQADNWDTLIEVSPAETRIAVVDDDGLLRRFRLERINAKSVVGAIYKARVRKIEKGTGGAFLTLGDRSLGDVFLPRAPKSLTEGQYTFAQVIRTAEQNKGAAVTIKPSLKGRYCTYFPTSNACTVDRRCGQGRRRAELEALLDPLRPETGGFMINWAGVCVEKPVIANELRVLSEKWIEITDAFERKEGAGLLNSAPAAVDVAILEAPPEGRIAIDDRRVHASMREKIEKSWPDLKDGLLFHDPRSSIFSASGIDAEIDSLSERKVPVPGGGSLSIDRVEAMTVIDVNLSNTKIAPDGFAGTVKLNLRAVQEVARQIELRNMSGLIVVDFVSMRSKDDRKKIVDALRKILRNSSVPTDVLGMTAAGLVEITRQRGETTISDLLLTSATEPAIHPAAEGAAILRELVCKPGSGKPFVKASKSVIQTLQVDLAEALRETEQRVGQPIILEEQATQGWEIILRR